jgi:hypothetical protein
VVVSYAHRFGVDIDNAIYQLANPGTGTPTTDVIARQVYNTWSMNVRSWTQSPLPGLLTVRYEDMAGETFKTFAGVARFLGLDPPRERLQRAIANSSFKSLRAQEDERGFVERSQHARFFRSGQVGQWKGVLSEEQVDRIVTAHCEQMKRFGYVPKSHR